MSDISSKPAQRSAFSVRDICYSGLFAAVIAIMAQISIPMPGGVPMTMQTSQSHWRLSYSAPS